jgi:hypothetical protein
MENYEINDAVESVVEVGEELMPAVVNESNGLAKAGYVGLGAALGIGIAFAVKGIKKLVDNHKAKKKAKEVKDVTEEKIDDIPGEETDK